ncbi:MAG TPA: beta-ketoacyl synthase N-terminal-like domain-containing protein [Bryobacteraceae bacterium]|nr:beta-ketoacyl synthase N-terminal-like domain-containing protein [Bryobacteraceae bacterium]
MSQPPCNDIAIIGLSCVFPGAGDARRYWQNILDKVDSVSDAPADWEAERFFDAGDQTDDRTYCKRGGFLGELSAFDPSLYGVMPTAVDGAEPDHFLALRNASDALRDAGYSDIGKLRERTEVIIGRGTYVNRGNATAMQHSMVLDSVLGVLRQLHPEYSDDELATIRKSLKSTLPPFHADTAPGLVPNIISGRIANRLDLMGANYIVDAACASSLVAVDLAIRDLQSGRCDMALAGGVNASVPPVIMIIFSQLNALSRSGQIRPFDAEASGTLLGEGGGMVVLKRLADAERDGDKIYAVIKGVGVASDGRAKGLLAPRLEGELLALRRAYEAAGVDPASVGLIEAHGTATLVGDATEMEALSQVFGGDAPGIARCALGSVKSMISHTMPASGIAGLIKVALALHHKVLPPTLHCETPNPKLHLDKSNFYLNSETRPWIHDASSGPRRAGVNAFGFGGINAHAVVEEYAGPSRAPWMQHEWDAECFIVSAESDEQLPAAISAVLATLERLPADTPLRNIAYTLNCEYALGLSRVAVVAGNRQELTEKLSRASTRLQDSRTRRIREVEGIYFCKEPLGGTGRVALMFPGEGAQYAGMLSDLCIHFPEVRQWFDFMNEAFANRGYRLSDSVYPPPGVAAEARLFSMDVGAEAVFCGNQAVHALLSHLGIQPDAVVGHSTGEHSALLASGIVRTDTKAALLHHVRGVNQVFEELQHSAAIQTGVLLAVAGVAPAAVELLARNSGGKLFIALDNCPNQVVLFGSEESVRKARESLANTAAICQELPFGRAYHTPLFAAFAERLREHFESVTIAPPRIATYSCVTSEAFPSDGAQIRELASVQWSSAVRFRETIENMHRDGIRLFIEAGPRSGLTGFVGDILRRKQHCCVPANVQHRTGIHQLQHLVAELVAHHVPVNLKRLYERRNPQSISGVAAPARPLMRIKMGLQPVRLPADFKPLLKPRVDQPQPVGQPVGQPANVPAPAKAPEPQPAAAALAAHMQTMSQFLETQQRVLNSYFATRNAPQTAAAPAQPALPFISDVKELVPGVKARILLRLSPVDQPLLVDHTLGRNVSLDDPSLLALPVFPLTFTMEVLAEAGATLAPGKKLVGMRDVRASRWVALEHGEKILDITAEQTPEAGAVMVRVREFSESTLRPVCAEGLMVFADHYPQPPAAKPLALTHRKASAWSPDRLYAEGMFHGPSLRAVRSMDETGSNGTSATLEVLPRNTLVKDHPEPGFLTDPVVLDAAGQVVAFWSQECLQKAGDIFPYRLGALHCYGPLRAPGTRLRCDVAVTHVGDKDIHSDIEIRDAQGSVLYRLESWEDRRFLLPRALWDLRLFPRSTRTGIAWLDPIRHLTGNPVFCARVDLAPELLEASHGIWTQVLAHLVLSSAERQEWTKMTGTAAQQWLAGRCAAKDAVRILVKETAGLDVCAADVEIHSGLDDRLFARGRWVQRLGAAPSVSLSYTTGTAVAIAALTQGNLLGVDVKHLAELAHERATESLSSSERRVLQDSAGSAADEWYVRACCAKQSLKNALGNGFLHHPSHAPVVTALALETGTIDMELTNGDLDRYPELKGKRIRVQTVRDRELVCSTTFLERSAGAGRAK